MPERIIKTIDGKRGSFLLFGGGAYLFIGLSYVLATTAGRVAAFSWLPSPLNSQNLGWVWVASGVLVTTAAVLSKPWRRLEAVAFSALMLCPGLWVLIFGMSTVLGVHPHGWVSAIAYGLISAWVWVVSGWDNPTPVADTGPVRTVTNP